MEGLRLYWLGDPAVELKGRLVKLETRKCAALLAYLSTGEKRYQREAVATIFWPEASQKKAFGNLRRTLSSLKSTLPGWIDADRETISIKKTGQLWCDVAAFHEVLARVKEFCSAGNEFCEECRTALEEAIRLYRGDFLDGLSLTDAPKFDDWEMLQREELRRELGEALQRLALAHSRSEKLDQAIQAALRWVALDPLYQPAHRLLMELYGRSGKRSAALRQYEQLQRLLKQGGDVEEETQRLYQEIQGSRAKSAAGHAAPQQFSFPILKTKLYVPSAPASRVERIDLVGKLRQAEQCSLTLISAPAGFGKTTLLAEWIAQCPLPVAWLSVDDGDNDLYRFLTYLIAALETICDGVGAEAKHLMQSPQPVPWLAILACLINDLEKVAEPYALVLDDYQFLTQHTVHEAVSYLLDHFPTNMHLVVSTRADPPLQLARLRASERLLELRTQDLRFTTEEVTHFLNVVMRLGLSDEDISALELRTEGWAVGLKMAALSLKGHENASEFIRDFSGSHQYILDYLLEEVLKRQPARIQTFLLETSIVEKLNSSLCDALMTDEWRKSGEGARAILEYLGESNLFLVPLDERKQWYRYHHLFADLLQSRLRQAPAERIAKLHLDASHWYEAHGLVLEAVSHAIDAKDLDRAADLVEQMAFQSIPPSTNYATLQIWIDRIPKDLVWSRPWICVAQAYISTSRGQLGKGQEWLQKAETALQTAPGYDPDQAEEIRNNITILRAYHAFFLGDVAKAVSQGKLVLEKQSTLRPELRGQVYQAMGEFYSTTGDQEECIPLLREAIRLGIQIPNLFLLTRCAFRLGRVLKSRGRLTEAQKVYQDNLAVLRASGLKDSPLLGRPEIGLGDALRERGDLSTADGYLAEGLRHSRLQGQPYDLIYAYLYSSRLEIARSNVGRAVELIEQGGQLFETYAMPAATRAIWEYYCIPLWIAVNDWPRIERWVGERHLESDLPVTYPNEQLLMAFSRVRIAQGKLAESLKIMVPLAEELEAAGRSGRLIEVWNLSAIALNQAGRTGEALNLLRKSLARGEPEGFRQIFLDEGKTMIGLLQRLQQSDLAPRLREYVNRLLEPKAVCTAPS